MSRFAVPIFAVALAAMMPLAARADGGDHERARQALEAGQVLPLARILEAVSAEHPGEVVEVELEREDGRWVYELKLLQAGGRIAKLRVDARDARVIEPRGRATRESQREDGR